MDWSSSCWRTSAPGRRTRCACASPSRCAASAARSGSTGCRIFQRLELLGPRRRIRIFLDRAALFFARDEPTAFEARIAWRTDEGERRSRTVAHDLDAYRDFPYLEVPRDAPAAP
jgi:hypothetical protein